MESAQIKYSPKKIRDFCILYLFQNTEEKVELDEKFYPLGAIVNEIQVDSKDVFYKNNIENAFDMKVGEKVHSHLNA